MGNTTTADQPLTAEQVLSGDSGEQSPEAQIARSNMLERRGDFTMPVRHAYDPAQVEVIRQTVAKDCNTSELALFLEVAGRYGLDPFLKEVYAAKFDGSSGGVTIFTGRDGLLKAARNSGQFVRMESAVVRENDTFEVELDLDPSKDPELKRIKRLVHKRTGMGEQRGSIIGAYALVYRKGDPEPWYAEASWEDYGKHRQKDGGGKPTAWTVDSRKGFPEAMMRKVPESIALRMAFGLAGIVGAEELGDTPERVQNLSDPGGAAVGVPAEQVQVQWGEDALGAELRELVRVANDLVPNSWRMPKVAMRINGKDLAARVKLRDQLRRFIDGRGAPGKQALEKIEMVPVDEHGEVTDAQVVGEKPAETGSGKSREDDRGPAPDGRDEPGDEGEEVQGEPVEEGLPPYDARAHSMLIDQVLDLRGTLEGMGDEADSDEAGSLKAELAHTEEQLRLMNLAAEAAGESSVEV